MYDLHVHIVDHSYRKNYLEKIWNYLLKAEIGGLEALGFVDHYPSFVNLKKVKERIDEIKRDSDIPIYYGAEIYYPLKKAPKFFDYTLLHVGGEYSLKKAIKESNFDIVAHPQEFDILEVVLKKKVLIEANEKYLLKRDFYKNAFELGIKITVGSDAHQPNEMVYREIKEKKIPFTPIYELGFL